MHRAGALGMGRKPKKQYSYYSTKRGCLDCPPFIPVKDIRPSHHPVLSGTGFPIWEDNGRSGWKSCNVTTVAVSQQERSG